MADLIHLNGPPGIGKSTIARLFVTEHPWTLNCDIDLLRSLIGGWSTDFARSGVLIRPVALSVIEAYLSSGHDVVLPQMLCDPAELGRFESAASRAGARFVERFLMTDADQVVHRFHRRGSGDTEDPWHAQVRAIVASTGGDELLLGYHSALEELIAQRSGAVVIESVEGDPQQTYANLIASLC